MKQLNPDELNRFSRHFSLSEIGETGQLKLKNAKVLVVGAGGLGSPLLLYLAAAGVGTVGIADNDVVSLSNLQRQVLYTTPEIGLKKADLAAQRMKSLYPEIDVQVFCERLTAANAEKLISGYDVVADCSDNFTTRRLLGTETQRLQKPLAFASVMNYEGQLTVFNFLNGPSFGQLYPKLPEDGIYQAQDIGLIGVLPGITGCLQANEIIKIITGYGEVLSGKLLVFSILENRFNLFSI